MSQTICVYCGGYAQVPQKYKADAAAVARHLAQNHFDIVYGGSRIGLMGAVADSALAAGGKVIGIIPEFLRNVEFEHTGLSETHIVPDLHSRKRMMIERSDAFLILPGGVGTLDEAFEVILWKKLKLHDKPIIIYNQNGYWSDLIAVINKTIAEGFSRPAEGAAWYLVATDPDQVVDLLASSTQGAPDRAENI